jgi:hypothetical protein
MPRRSAVFMLMTIRNLAGRFTGMLLGLASFEDAIDHGAMRV